MKKYRGRASDILFGIIIGFVVCSLAIPFIDKMDNGLQVWGILLLAMVIFVIVYNQGEYFKIEGDTITKVQFFRVKETYTLKDFKVFVNSDHLLFTDLSDAHQVKMRTNFMSKKTLNRLLMVLKPLSVNDGLKEIEVLN